MASHPDDELKPSVTEGYKVGEKKSIDEYAKLDAEDESLARWKASLGIGAGAGAGPSSIGAPGDTRTAVILQLCLLVEGRAAVEIDLDSPEALETLRKKPFTIKEGIKYRMKVRFRIQHEVISGLRYLQLTKRKGVKVGKDEEMMGSYPPNTKENPFYEKIFPEEQAPSGMLFRGHYEAVSKFMDDDHKAHLDFNWSFEIKKNWD